MDVPLKGIDDLFQLLNCFRVLWPMLSMAFPAAEQGISPKRVYRLQCESTFSSRAESQHGSPQLSSFAVQVSIVSGVAVVCLQALPNCFSPFNSLQ